MSAWLLASLGMLPPLLVGLVAACRGPIADRTVGLQFAFSIALFLVVDLSFAFDQASSIELALTVSLLSLPGTLLLAHFQERWL